MPGLYKWMGQCRGIESENFFFGMEQQVSSPSLGIRSE
jgi:hypothetical protein